MSIGEDHSIGFHSAFLRCNVDKTDVLLAL